MIETRKAGRPRNPDVHEAILRATAELIGTAGYANLSIEGVAQRAGVSVGTLYQYYPNKQALLCAVLENHLTHVMATGEAACEAHAINRWPR